MPWDTSLTSRSGLFDASVPKVAIFKPRSTSSRKEKRALARAARCRKLIARLPGTTTVVLRDVFLTLAGGREDATLSARAVLGALRDGMLVLAYRGAAQWSDEIVDEIVRKTDRGAAGVEPGRVDYSHYLAAAAQMIRTATKENASSAARPHSNASRGAVRSGVHLPAHLRGVAGVRQLLGALASGTRSLFGRPITTVDSMFAAMDQDGNGVIDWPEFQGALERLDIVVEGETFTKLMSAIDVNTDGAISLVEFRRAMAWLERTELSGRSGVKMRKKRKKKTMKVGGHALGRPKLGARARAGSKPRRSDANRRAAPAPAMPTVVPVRSPAPASQPTPQPQPQPSPMRAPMPRPAAQPRMPPSPMPAAPTFSHAASAAAPTVVADDPVLGALRALLAQQSGGATLSKEEQQRVLKEALRQMYTQREGSASAGASVASPSSPATRTRSSNAPISMGGDRAAQFGAMLNTIVRQLVDVRSASGSARQNGRQPLAPVDNSAEQQRTQQGGRRKMPQAKAVRRRGTVPRLQRFNGIVTRGQIDSVVSLLIEEMLLEEASGHAARRKLDEVIEQSDGRQAELRDARAALLRLKEAEDAARKHLDESKAVEEADLKSVAAARFAAQAKLDSSVHISSVGRRAQLIAPDYHRVAVLASDAASHLEYRKMAEESINPGGNGRAQWELIEL